MFYDNFQWLLRPPEFALCVGRGRVQSKVAIDGAGRDSAARCALQETLLDEIGFEHVFDGVARLANGCGEVVDACATESCA